MADDIDDLLSCIEKKMNTVVKPWDDDDDDDVKSPSRNRSRTNKTTSDKSHKK